MMLQVQAGLGGDCSGVLLFTYCFLAGLTLCFLAGTKGLDGASTRGLMVLTVPCWQEGLDVGPFINLVPSCWSLHCWQEGLDVGPFIKHSVAPPHDVAHSLYDLTVCFLR